MRHRKRKTRFGRQSAHRIATLKALTKSVIVHQRIKTTRAKAKEAKRVIDNLITLAKRDSLQARRRAYAILGDRGLVTRLFKDIAPLFTQREGGYTRIIPFDFRRGDGANMVFLELTEKKPEEKPRKKAVKKPERDEVVKKEEPKTPPKAAPELKPHLKEEKTVEEVRREKAKDEERKLTRHKGFLRRIRGFFRRKTNM